MTTKTKTKDASIEVCTRVSLDAIAGLLCSAFEGGTGYRAQFEVCLPPGAQCPPELREDWLQSRHTWAPLAQGGAIKLWDAGVPDELLGVLDRAAIERGLALLMQTRHGADLLSGESDASTGDALVQLAVFGEIIYG